MNIRVSGPGPGLPARLALGDPRGVPFLDICTERGFRSPVSVSLPDPAPGRGPLRMPPALSGDKGLEGTVD